MKRIKSILKKLITFLISLLFFMTAVPATVIPVFALQRGDITYTLINGDTEIEISHYPNSAEISASNRGLYVNLPSSIDSKPVTSVGNHAFSFCDIEGITIPNGVTSIGASAFYSCLLTSVTIPNSVTNIDDQAFFASKLKNLSIPNGVTSIGTYAFGQCYDLTSVTIPDSVTNLATGVFALCPSLSSISIPSSITSIGQLAFNECSGLTRITIPNSVTSIGQGAFLGCNNELTFYTAHGSYAASYAITNGIKVEYTDAPPLDITTTSSSAVASSSHPSSSSHPPTSSASNTTTFSPQSTEVTSSTSDDSTITTSAASSLNESTTAGSEQSTAGSMPDSNVIDLTGYLLDVNNNPIPKTTVELHSQPRTTKTDENGLYSFCNVEYGDHIIYVKDDNGIEIAQMPFTIIQGQKTGQADNVLTISGTKVSANLILADKQLTLKLFSSENSNSYVIYIIISVVFVLLIATAILMYLFKIKFFKRK